MSDKELFQSTENISSQERETFFVFRESQYELQLLEKNIKETKEYDYTIHYPPELQKLLKTYVSQEEKIALYWDNFNSNKIFFYDDPIFIKVALIFAKECPRDMLDYYDNYKNKPYAKSILKEIKGSFNGYTTKDIIDLCKSHLSFFIAIGEKDFIKGLLKKAFKESSYIGYDLLQGFGSYGEILIEAGEMTFIKDILQGIAEKEPFGASHTIRLFEQYGPLLIAFGERDFIKNLLMGCLQRNLDPDGMVSGFQEYGTLLLEEGYGYIVKDLLKGFLEKYSGRISLIRGFDKYGPAFIKRGDKEFISIILSSLGDEQPGIFMNNFDYEKNKSFLPKEIIDPIMNRLTLKLFDGAFIEPVSNEVLTDVKNNISSLHLPNGSTLALNPSHINIYSGLLKTYLMNKNKYNKTKESTIDWNRVKEDYEINIKNFIEEGKEWSELSHDVTHVFVVRASKKAGDDKKNSLTYSNERLKQIYKDKLSLKGTFHDYSSDVNPQSPEKILDAFEDHVKRYPYDKHFFHIGGHGGVDGSIYLKGGQRKKKHFEKLLTIQAKNPHLIKIDISSCNSGYKDENFYDNTIKNLSLDSVRHSSFGGKNGSEDTFLEAFEIKDQNGKLKADYDRDGIINFNEALLYRNIHNNSSLAMTMFDDGQGNPIDISMLLHY